SWSRSFPWNGCRILLRGQMTPLSSSPRSPRTEVKRDPITGIMVSDSCWNGHHWDPAARVCASCGLLHEPGRKQCIGPGCFSIRTRIEARGCTQGDCGCHCHKERSRPIREVKPKSLDLPNEPTPKAE